MLESLPNFSDYAELFISIYILLIFVVFMILRSLDKPLDKPDLPDIVIKPIKMSSSFMEFHEIPPDNPRNEVTFF